jgi:hypothetical protein
MKKTSTIVSLTAAFAFAVIPLLSQTAPKRSFEVVSIKKSAPNVGPRYSSVRGDRLTMSGANLRVLLPDDDARCDPQLRCKCSKPRFVATPSSQERF